jgi:hypothetical protein
VEKQPAALIKRLFDFLGVDDGDFDYEDGTLKTPVHSGGRPIPPEVHEELVALYRDEIQVLARIYPCEYTRHWAAALPPHEPGRAKVN